MGALAGNYKVQGFAHFQIKTAGGGIISLVILSPWMGVTESTEVITNHGGEM